MNVLFAFFTVKKLYPYLEKIKFVYKLMHFEHDNVENNNYWQHKGTLKQMSFTCIKVTKGFVICVRGEEGYNHQQSFTKASRQGHIVVKVLALRYKNIL